ncbi:MAG: DUF58 domain-containing protein [Candidatus Marinimicrobia bacterium]|nr:DUF58 domain-containing protein [Candidatus Neomarinimicrobiota bacterium]
MIPTEIIEKVRHIEIRTRGLVNDIFGGEYHSVFKGRGMSFSEVREYFPGDDIRLIDWNVTARSNLPHVKIFEEERELTVYLIVDISKSGDFGTLDKYKNEIATEIAAVLGFSAIKNNDKVGLIMFSDKIEKYVPPKKGKSHVLRVVRELLYHKSEGQKTSINNALDFLLKVAKRRSVVFLISDYIDHGYWKSLKIANRKHDLIGIKVSDIAESYIPNLGLLKIHDPESNQEFWVDTSSKSDRLNFSNNQLDTSNNFKKECDKIKFDLIQIDTNEDYVDPLMSFFKGREKRI